jgi:hypothetical protein
MQTSGRSPSLAQQISFGRETGLFPRAAKRRAFKNQALAKAPARRLTPAEVQDMTTILVFDRTGKPSGAKLNTLGGRRGIAHTPVASSLMTDATGREYRVIHTELRDLKAEARARKKADRAMKLAA